jgi:hypothetical protein
MQYMLLIYDDETLWQTRSEAEGAKIMQEYFAYTTDLQKSGAFVAGAPLQPTQSATAVRVRDGQDLVTDGPFAETKEQLGGYYLIDVETLDEALEWARKIPGARSGTIEVRPVLQIGAEAPA